MHSCRRILAGTFALGLAGVAISACGAEAAPQTLPVTAAKAAANGPATAQIDIPGVDRFSPFVVTVAPMGTITIKNADTDGHTVTSLPGSAVPFDLHIDGNGGTKTLQLPAGVYHYYCSAHAKYDDKTGQVSALPSSGFPDTPMEGVIVVS
ncbi:MAG: hypothetical protein JWM18_287 [Chloroflexi bacterium]|jgi:plastocyanin|nr:hypothetical protein [Chloroflexota bacterium]